MIDRAHKSSYSSIALTNVVGRSAESETGRSCQGVVLVSPGWPPGRIVNGIVSAVATSKKAFDALGVHCSVVSISQMDHCEDWQDNVYHVASFDRTTRVQRVWQRLMNGIMRIVAVEAHPGAETYPRVHIPGFESALDSIQGRQRVDLIEVEESFGLPDFVPRHSRLPVVARLHGPWILTGAASGAEPNEAFQNRVRAEGAAIINANGVSSPSRFVLRAVEERYQTELPLSAVIPNAVEAVAESSIWNPQTADSSHVLFVGRFDRLKGADLCLRALVKVLEQRPQTQLTIVGPDHGIVDEKTDRNRCAKEWLNDEIQSTQLRSRINLRGSLSRAEIVSLRCNAAVTLVPSRFENFPNTVLEAMAQGCPIVASRVGGIPEIIEHERNGMLCAVEDVDDLAAKILTLLKNRSFAADLGRKALHDSHIHYSPITVAKRNLEFYEEVISRGWHVCSASNS